MSSISEHPSSANLSHVTGYVDALLYEGQLLMLAAERLGLDDPVPTCPQWRVRDLLRHLGGVHRWATTHVAGRRAKMLPRNEEPAIMQTWPADANDADALLGWFKDGYTSLLHSLRNADPELECWRFLPAASGTSFWARRMAHETAIHRADVEATKGLITPFEAGHAADGIDEVLRGFFGRPTEQLQSTTVRTLALVPTDTGTGWHVTLGSQRVDVTDPNFAEASCTVRATASNLYLLVWNRIGWEHLDVEGDQTALQYWRDHAHVGE